VVFFFCFPPLWDDDLLLLLEGEGERKAEVGQEADDGDGGDARRGGQEATEADAHEREAGGHAEGALAPGEGRGVLHEARGVGEGRL